MGALELGRDERKLLHRQTATVNLTIGEGSVMFDDIRGHQDRLLADRDFDVSFDQLIDTTAVTEFDISASEARILAERRIVSPESRRAFVATEPTFSAWDA